MLELHADRELQLARVGGDIDTGSLSYRSILLDVAARQAKVDVIERVKGVHSELEYDALFDWEVLLHGDICVEEMRSEDAVPANVPDLIQTRRSKHRTQGLLVIIRKTIAGEAGYVRFKSRRLTVDHTRCRAWNTCVARAIRERERKTT